MPTKHPRPYRRGSRFGDGRRRRLDREQRARFRYLARCHARAGRLSAKSEWVALALLKRLGEDGRCDPSHATLAADAGCDVRTVGRATARLRALGLLSWDTRMIRTEWRAEQTSNAYELCPEASCDGQTVRETRRKYIVRDSMADEAAVQAAREALDARVKEMMARLAR